MARARIKKFEKMPPMKSVSGLPASKGKVARPSMSKDQSTKAADKLASMGFGKGFKTGF